VLQARPIRLDVVGTNEMNAGSDASVVVGSGMIATPSPAPTKPRMVSISLDSNAIRTRTPASMSSRSGCGASQALDSFVWPAIPANSIAGQGGARAQAREAGLR